MVGMSINRRAADEALKHARIETGSARLLEAQAASGLLAHGSQYVLLRAQIILRVDFCVADADQGPLAVAPKNVGDAPDRKTNYQETDQDQAECPCRAFAQCVEYHASKPSVSLFAKSALASDVRTVQRGGRIIGSKRQRGNTQKYRKNRLA
jgi:hypothetical protein